MLVKDKVVLITGGAGGIGRETALTLARQGAKIAILDIKEEDGLKTKSELNAITEALFVQVDLRPVGNIGPAVEKVNAHFGRIDVLVNNAAISSRATVDALTEEAYDLIMDINLKSCFFMAQAVGKIMMAQKSGKIINVSSIRARMADKTHAAYSMTKAAMDSMTRSFAIGLADYGITTNSVAPGYVLTPMTAHNLERPEWLDWLKTKVPLGRLIEMQEVANLILFLSSDLSDAINGEIISVDGGWMANE